MKAPVYGHPADIEHAVERAPCRHCLRLIRPGAERQILFTYDRFAGVEALPLGPGPVYIHEHACERYPENAEDSRMKCGRVHGLWKDTRWAGAC